MVKMVIGFKFTTYLKCGSIFINDPLIFSYNICNISDIQYTKPNKIPSISCINNDENFVSLQTITFTQ